MLAGLPDLAAWWDASTPAGVTTIAGEPATAWNASIASIADKSLKGAALLPYSATGQASAPVVVPHLNGLLGGVGRIIGAAGSQNPDLDPELGFQPQGTVIPSIADWTFYLVWSRPNWRQQSGKDEQPVTLLTVNGTPVIQGDSRNGLGRLTLFPGDTATILKQDLARRHTHSVVLRYNARQGFDVWVDDAKVATGVPSRLTGSQAGPTLLLHDGSTHGSAQCWLHEAAVWNAALSDSDITALLGYSARWRRGPRRGLILLFNGQSNAINYTLADGAADLLARGVAWHVGALACNVVASTGDPASYTMQSGHGIYAARAAGYPGSFLSDPGDGSDPSEWQLGQDGQALAQVIAGLAPEDRAEICALVWPWSETDSVRNYSEKATFSAAARRFLSLERGLLGASAGDLPLIWWNAIPYGSQDGIQMHREVVAAAAGDPSLNVWIGNPQTSDSNPRNSTWDARTGIAGGGDYGHRDSMDNQRFARLASPIVAHALTTSGHADTLNALPPSLPQRGGPKIQYAFRLSGTSVILRIQHDAGTDLKVPLQAAAGAGFAVMDGGSADNPGPVVPATACERLDATHLRLTLAQPLVRSSNQCHLYYPFGGNSIGRGNAVTDNYSDLAKPAGWNIAEDLGSAWNLDFPLAAIFSPIALSDSPA